MNRHRSPGCSGAHKQVGWVVLLRVVLGAMAVLVGATPEGQAQTTSIGS